MKINLISLNPIAISGNVIKTQTNEPYRCTVINGGAVTQLFEDRCYFMIINSRVFRMCR